MARQDPLERRDQVGDPLLLDDPADEQDQRLLAPAVPRACAGSRCAALAASPSARRRRRETVEEALADVVADAQDRLGAGEQPGALRGRAGAAHGARVVAQAERERQIRAGGEMGEHVRPVVDLDQHVPMAREPAPERFGEADVAAAQAVPGGRSGRKSKPSNGCSTGAPKIRIRSRKRLARVTSRTCSAIAPARSGPNRSAAGSRIAILRPAAPIMAQARSRAGSAGEHQQQAERHQDQPGRQGQELLDRRPEPGQRPLLDQRLEADQAVGVDPEPDRARAEGGRRAPDAGHQIGQRRGRAGDQQGDP